MKNVERVKGNGRVFSSVNQIMLYFFCKSTEDRIRHLLGRIVRLLTKPIDKMVCRVLGHGNIWVIDGWPYPDIRCLTCSRCGQWKVVRKDTDLTPRLYIYDPKTKAIIKVEPMPKSPFRRDISLEDKKEVEERWDLG